MAEKCVKVGCPEVVRLALQDPCTGAPIPGAANGVVMRCTRNTTVEKVLRDEEVSEFVADCGPADRYVIEPQLQGFNVNIEVSQFSPEAEALLTGEALLTSGSTNIGVLYEGGQGCVSQDPAPRFIGEFFFRRRGACDPGTVANYIRLVVLGIRFNPFEIGAEGQIRFQTVSGTSDAPLPLAGLVDGNAGPYDDLEAALVTDLGGFDADTTAYGFWVADPITDPTAGITLAANTCYTATVPVVPT